MKEEMNEDESRDVQVVVHEQAPEIYRCAVRMILLAAMMLAAATTASADSHLTNISTRGFVGLNENVLIAGAILTGDAPRQIVVRALGPTLQQFGVINALQDPVMDIFDENGNRIDGNDDWQDDSFAQTLIDLGFAPSNSPESAIYRPSVAPGKYTVVVHGFNSTTGIGLVEIYDLGP